MLSDSIGLVLLKWLGCIAYMTITFMVTAEGQINAQVVMPSQDFFVEPIDPSDKMAIESLVKGWLLVLENSPNDEEEHAALISLFGYPPIGHSYEPTNEVKTRLLDRRLRYKSWQSRKAALNGFILTFLEDDPQPVIPIFCEGLEDSHASVRQEAVRALGEAIAVIQEGPNTISWSPSTKRRIETNKKALIGRIIDKIIAKGVVDTDEEVVGNSLLALAALKTPPSEAQVELLGAAISNRHIRPDAYLNHAKELYSKWYRSIHGESPPNKIDSPTSGASDKNGVEQSPFGS